MNVRRAGGLILLAAVLLASTPAGATGEMVAIGIERSLESMSYQRACDLYDGGREDVHGSLQASLRVAAAFVDFAGQREVLRYEAIPEESVSVAIECLEACEKHLEMRNDDEARLRIARLYHDGALVYIKAGVGDKGEKAELAALGHVEELVAIDPPMRGASLLLGEIQLALSKADPRKARERIAAARAAFDKAREVQGDSAALVRCSAGAILRLAEIIELEKVDELGDRKVKKELCGLYEEALAAYKAGLKLAKEDLDLKTGYNACVWRVMSLNRGKCRERPILKEVESRYHRLKLRVPESRDWVITPPGELEDEDDVLRLVRLDREEGQAYVVWVSRYGWSYAYTNPETGESIGGDNIKGLAKRSHRSVREIYADIKNERPLHKAPLSRRIRKAYMYRMEGRSKDNDLFEIRGYFFKHSKAQKTYCILIFANMGMLERNPYELEVLLDGFEMVTRKRRR